MEVTGKIIFALPEMSGISKAGNSWKKKEYVLETNEQYPKKIHFDFFGERADQYPLQVGQEIKLFFDIESREYQGRWYTQIRGWKYEQPDAAQAPAQVADPFQQAPFPGAQPAATAYPGAAPATTAYPGAVPPPPVAPAQPTDDLPF